MGKYTKYPRTPHLPFSRSMTSDDIMSDTLVFMDGGIETLITEKMDGESTTLYNDKYHARSIDSIYHPSRSVIARKHGEIGYMIPENRRIIVENCYAEHSIRYDNLDDFIFGIAVVDLIDGVPTYLGWDDTLKVFKEYGIQPVPVLYKGTVNENILKDVFNSLDHEKKEGIVARTYGSFAESEFSKNVAKAVRKNHVQTDEHWLREWKPNCLRG